MKIMEHDREKLFEKYKCDSCRPPKKGEMFFRASGKRGIVNIEIADNDFKTNCYGILEKRTSINKIMKMEKK